MKSVRRAGSVEVDSHQGLEAEKMTSYSKGWSTLAIMTLFLGVAGMANAERRLDQSLFEEHMGGCCDKCSNIACTCCDSPGTLMQWSYGNSFSGGPDLDEPLVTDRPDFTEASSTVGLGVAQIEFGYTYGYDNDGTQSVRSESFGEPLLRYGIGAEWLEFRVAVFPAVQRTRQGAVSDTTTGMEDLYLGFKVGLTPQECLLPEMALIPQMNVPVGSNNFSSGSIEPGLNWIYGWEVTEFISTAGSSQANRRIDDNGDAYVEFAQSWTVAYSLTDILGAYTEWFALIPNGNNTALTEHYFNGGFTILLSDDIQFDVRAGVGLNDAAEDYFVGSGLSVRFR